MSATTRAAYEQTRAITERVCAKLGIAPGDWDAHSDDIKDAVFAICYEAGVSKQTAKKHLDRYIYGITPRKWGPEFKNKPKSDEKGE